MSGQSVERSRPGRKLKNETQITEMRRLMHKLRIMGWSYHEIGEHADVQLSVPTVRQHLARWAADVAAEELPVIRQQNYDALMMAKKAIATIMGSGHMDDPALALKAIDSWVRTHESGRRLMGVDAPIAAAIAPPEVLEADKELAELIKAKRAENKSIRDEMNAISAATLGDPSSSEPDD